MPTLPFQNSILHPRQQWICQEYVFFNNRIFIYLIHQEDINSVLYSMRKYKTEIHQQSFWCKKMIYFSTSALFKSFFANGLASWVCSVFNCLIFVDPPGLSFFPQDRLIFREHLFKGNGLDIFHRVSRFAEVYSTWFLLVLINSIYAMFWETFMESFIQ